MFFCWQATGIELDINLFNEILQASLTQQSFINYKLTVITNGRSLLSSVCN